MGKYYLPAASTVFRKPPFSIVHSVLDNLDFLQQFRRQILPLHDT